MPTSTRRNRDHSSFARLAPRAREPSRWPGPPGGCSRSRSVGNVRAFTRDDILRVAQLHREVFRPATATAGTPARIKPTSTASFSRIRPAKGLSLRWCTEERDGRIVGFLGIVRRRVAINDCRYEAAVSSQFIVGRQASKPLVAVRLVQAYLEGPQDLSIADEATEAARRIWEGFSGSTSLLHSLDWTRPLRPARLVHVVRASAADPRAVRQRGPSVCRGAGRARHAPAGESLSSVGALRRGRRALCRNGGGVRAGSVPRRDALGGA